MGILGKLMTGTLLTKGAQRYERNQEAKREGQYIPANELDQTRGGTGHALVGRATRFYRENPTLVHALAATAGAVLLTSLRRRRY
jgi:hypothetical protein